ncbi:MAG TPA: LLM class flavin-dependent oxidoreductase [Dehalococcoidia bacterium]|nr:LLM class flavin-dependent oxidoreductase [Dehalococcoidia bacterium]
MAAKLNVGLRLPAVHGVKMDDLRAFVLAAEKLGFHSIWVGDHVYHHVDVLQPLERLTWVAALTYRVRLGTAVMLTAYLNPVLLAKAAASLDYMSGGRLQLGISIGGTPPEYKSIGVPANQRVGRLLENVAIMRALWSGDDISYYGRYNQIEAANIKPKPVQKPGVPLYFGANTEAMLRRAARHADGWVGSAGPTTKFLEGVTYIRQTASDLGRDPNTLALAKLQGVSVHPDRAQAKALAERQWQSYYGPRFSVDAATIYGTPDEVATKLSEFGNADAPEITLALEPPTLNLDLLALLFETTQAFSNK